jgi:hypothetical protein
MTEQLLAAAGILLSSVAFLIRELRLLMGEVRRWRKPAVKASRKSRSKK